MYVRLMRRGDIDQVARIDREAFPTEWPPTNFARELENRLAYYIVACEDPSQTPVAEQKIVSTEPPGRNSGVVTESLRGWKGWSCRAV